MDIYSERAAVVAALARAARETGRKVWFGVDPKEPEWPVLFIDLPTGQVSWHFSAQDRDAYASDISNGSGKWDGHTTEEKYARLAAWLKPRARRRSSRRRSR